MNCSLWHGWTLNHSKRIWINTRNFPRQSEKQLKKDVQLGIYALFLVLNGVEIGRKKIIKKLPKILSMLFLRENDPEISIQLSTDELNNFEEKIILVAKDIKKSKYDATKGLHCDWCDYRDLICPKYG